MAMIEDYILAHPYLMSADAARYPTAFGMAVLAVAALYFAFGQGKSGKDVPWSSWGGKCFRFSWIIAFGAVVVLAHDRWHRPERKDFSYPLLEYSLLSLWFVLFWTAMVLAIKKAVKEDKWRELNAKRNLALEFSSLIFVIPGCCSGISLAAFIAFWLPGVPANQPVPFLYALLFIILMVPFIVVGGLLGTFIWLLILSYRLSLRELEKLTQHTPPHTPILTPLTICMEQFVIQRKIQREKPTS